MTKHVYRYEFDDDVSMEDVEASLVLSLFATESLHGAALVRLDASHAFDADRRRCAIDASSAVGRDLNRLFTGFLEREFGPSSFKVRVADQLAA